jgi:hypothetical protein
MEGAIHLHFGRRGNPRDVLRALRFRVDMQASAYAVAPADRFCRSPIHVEPERLESKLIELVIAGYRALILKPVYNFSEGGFVGER